MLTARGWWFLLAVLVLQAFAGLVPPRGQTSLSLLAMTLLLWFAWEWLKFAVRARAVVRDLYVERHLGDERGPVETLWAGRAFEVRIYLRLRGLLSLPYVIISDRIPFGAELTAGEAQADGAVTPYHPLALTYHLRCSTAGKVRFEGLGVQLADLQGFFHHAAFLSAAATYRVLPPMADAEGRSAAVKRHNLLPPPGVHRHRRPGSGSELLDLRDYLPGDPPRTIAWKASARRDRLITKEFESEVPVRCTLFVDTSNSVRLGPPGHNALARLVEIAAVVAQANAGSRDLTGLCLFDEHDVTYIRPARSSRHLAHLLNLLTDAACLAPTTGQARVETLLPLAYAFALETYPEQMRPDVNAFPFWLPWLSPQPAYTLRRPTLADYLYGSPPILLVLFLAGFYVTAVATALAASDWVMGVLWLAGYLAFGLLLGAGYVFILGLVFPHRRRWARYRKRLAALLSARYGLAPGGLSRLLEDDEQFSLHMQRFLAEHHVPYALPLYDRDGRYMFAAPGKVEVLAGALLRAVGKGHDNELFVLLADLLELEEQLGPLLRAVKVTVARHHRVMVICPWPPGVPLPAERPGAAPPPAPQVLGTAAPLFPSLRRATTARYHRAFHQVRRTFARLGVPVVCAQHEAPARLILERLEGLRTLGRTR
jgi:uncharacterized protein (DUF58 family)